MELHIKNLHINLKKDPEVCLARDISFSVASGKTLGIVGESGSGKSITALSILNLLPSGLFVESGEIIFAPSKNENIHLLSISEKELRKIRGNHISMIFQDPMNSLNPSIKCGKQVMEMRLTHHKFSTKEVKQHILQLFKEVELRDPEKIFNSYPFELSGGQQQRVMIAMALINSPALLIADEPTTALDVTVQRTIINLLKKLQLKFNIGTIFISHDIDLIAEISDDILVMYNGKIVEYDTAKKIIHHPEDSYTKGLLACKPSLKTNTRRLPTIADYLEKSLHKQEPKIEFVEKPDVQPILQVNGLNINYPIRNSLFSRKNELFTAARNINFNIYPGQVLGIVGESGSGKTSIGKALVKLVASVDGNIVFQGGDIQKLSSKKLSRKIQIIFQNPYSALNPNMNIGAALSEVFEVHKKFKPEISKKEQIFAILKKVGLDEQYHKKYPHELSGGQRQRVAIAKALIPEPGLIVCDECVSALDVSVQATILNLLNNLKEKYNLAYIFISHDLAVVKYMSDYILVLNQGQIEEQNKAQEIYDHPQTLYTKALLDAVPESRS